MYGLNIVQRGGVLQTYPPYCALPYRANGQKCPLLKNEQNAEKPRKSFSKRWEPAQKRAGSVSPTCGGNGAWRSVRFSDRPWSGILPPHFGLLRFPTDAYNRPNFGQLPCEPSKGFHTEIRRLHDFPSRRADKNRSERRVEAHGGICRTWPDAEHIPLHLIFTRFPA